MGVFARLLLRLLGWNIYVRIPLDEPKAVIIMAPHTSNWDFIIGKLAFMMYNLHPKFLIKKEAFSPVLGPLLRWMGGVPVDRSQSRNTVKHLTEEFRRHDRFFLLITPEGTRRRVDRWKKGFYYIAHTANVPIYLAFLDYRKKEGGIASVFYPSGDFEADFKRIEAFYRDKHPRHPEKFNLYVGRKG